MKIAIILIITTLFGCASHDAELRIQARIIPGEGVSSSKAREVALYFLSHTPAWDITRKPIYVDLCNDIQKKFSKGCKYRVSHQARDPLCAHMVDIDEDCNASDKECKLIHKQRFGLLCA